MLAVVFFFAVLHVQLQFVYSGHCECWQWDTSKSPRVKKDVHPEDFEDMDDMIGCLEDQLGAKICQGWSDADEVSAAQTPVIHAITPDHCVFTATWAAATNNGKTTGWTATKWNHMAAQIDKIMTDKHVVKYIPLHRAAEYKFRFGKGKGDLKSGTGGAFTGQFAQIMLKTVGLNYGLTNPSVSTYPPEYNDVMFDVYHDASYLDLNYFKNVLNGAKKFKNSQGVQKPMLAMVFALNDFPYHVKEEPNHMVVLVKKATMYYYLDSNVHNIQDLAAVTHKSPTLTNVYKTTTVDNSPAKSTPDWGEGYAVDWSLKLGDDVDIVAQWLLDKSVNRPYHYVTAPTTIQELNPDFIGGAISFKIIVEDKVTSWKEIVEHYTAMNKEDCPWIDTSTDAKIDYDNYYDNVDGGDDQLYRLDKYSNYHQKYHKNHRLNRYRKKRHYDN